MIFVQVSSGGLQFMQTDVPVWTEKKNNSHQNLKISPNFNIKGTQLRDFCTGQFRGSPIYANGHAGLDRQEEQ